MKKQQMYFIITAAAILCYFFSGFYMLETGESAVTLRFGKKIQESTEPGIHYALPYPFDSVRKEYVTRVKKISVNVNPARIKGEEPDKNGLVIFTGDENLISLQAVVNFDINDLNAYFFSSADPDRTIKALLISCMSEEIAGIEVDTVMTTGKTDLRLRLVKRLQEASDRLNLGIRIVTVEFTEIAPPDQVSGAFTTVSSSRVKKQEIIREAEGYANTVVPNARGEAASSISMANAYASETVNGAQAGARVFNDLVNEYYMNPFITKRKLYLDTMKKIFETAKLRIESNPSSATLYIKNADSKNEQKNTGNEEE